MVWDAIGAIGGAIGGLIGGDKDSDAQEKANRINKRYSRRSIRLQKKFAQKGIRWKVKDARKAGLHPLAALGAQTHSFSPVSAGQQAYTGNAANYSNMGEAIGGAVSTMSPSSRQQREQSEAIASLAVERAGLENQLLKTKIASEIRLMSQPGRPPGLPVRNTDGKEDEGGDRTIMIGGNEILVPGNTAPASEITDEAGEPAEWLYFPWHVFETIMHNINNNPAWQKYRPSIKGPGTYHGSEHKGRKRSHPLRR